MNIFFNELQMSGTFKKRNGKESGVGGAVFSKTANQPNRICGLVENSNRDCTALGVTTPQKCGAVVRFMRFTHLRKIF